MITVLFWTSRKNGKFSCTGYRDTCMGVITAAGQVMMGFASPGTAPPHLLTFGRPCEPGWTERLARVKYKSRNIKVKNKDKAKEHELT